MLFQASFYQSTKDQHGVVTDTRLACWINIDNFSFKNASIFLVSNYLIVWSLFGQLSWLVEW